MRAWLAAGLAAWCAVDAAASPSTTRVVTIDGKTATLVEVGSTAKVAATVKLPSSAQKVVWLDRDPVALLVARRYGDLSDDPKLDGTVGKITPKGFVALRALPKSTWTISKPHEGSQKLDRPIWDLEASSSGELWLGRCEWGGYADGMVLCDDWVWARIGGRPLTSRVQPPSPDASQVWPTIPAAPGIAISFAKTQPQADGSQQLMTCRAGSASTTFPADPTTSWTDPESLHWVSTEPPIFVIDQLTPGFDLVSQTAVFEGCTESKRFGHATGHSGPASLFVLATDRASSLRRNGKELLALPAASLVEFSPDGGAPAATDPFALLDRQLAGDMSMFAPDAIVLSPAPGTSPPKLGKRSSARIERYASGAAGDATWLAAELTLDGKLYRAVELVDQGRVIVASFAPVKPLVRGGAPAAIPSPTPAGPLAAFAAAPAKAAAVLDKASAVFGTDPPEHANDYESKDLLAGWSTLALTLDPQVREVHTATYGYAIASVQLAKPGDAPMRMTALVIGSLDKGTWRVSAIHYLTP